MSATGRVKVRAHPGANVGDIYDHIKPHLRKRPTSVILHVGTNDASKPPAEIVEEIIELHDWITNYSETHVAISMPTIRNDQPDKSRNILSVQAMLRNTGVTQI